VETERVPRAAHGSEFIFAFEERTVFLAQQCSKTAVVKLRRTSWRTVGSLIRQVVERSRCADGDSSSTGGPESCGRVSYGNTAVRIVAI
jgi:hypothetical protein